MEQEAGGSNLPSSTAPGSSDPQAPLPPSRLLPNSGCAGIRGVSRCSRHLTTIESSTLKLGLPEYNRARIQKLSKFGKPKVTLFTRCNRLLMSSVGPYAALANGIEDWLVEDGSRGNPPSLVPESRSCHLVLDYMPLALTEHPASTALTEQPGCQLGHECRLEERGDYSQPHPVMSGSDGVELRFV